MLSHLDMGLTLDKKEYKDEMDILGRTLALLQQTLIKLQIPVMVVFEGFSASGKGTYIARVVHPLDPRYFKVHTMGNVDEAMRMRPFLCAFWVKTPVKGCITFFDKSWQRLMLPPVSDAWGLNPAEAAGFYYDANAFERQLTDDGTLVVKFFLHIDKDEQQKRFRELEKNPDTAWRVNAQDHSQNHRYDKHKAAYERMLAQTSEVTPWHVIEANDKKYAVVKIFRTLIQRIEHRVKAEPPRRVRFTPYDGPSFLAGVNPEKSIDNLTYKKEMDEYQQKLTALGYRLYVKRRSAVIVFEGWDAAGKGGSINRLTEELDPRSYEVVPIAAPNPQALSHHYLWRFYKKMPKDGHLAIFDRSWYGRVLIERVEKLTPEARWRQAYQEINDMETHLRRHGVIIVKFWLHIDRDEQLRRFTDRQTDPLKLYKITEEDWRNRGHWDAYTAAVDEMIDRTGTAHAPWTIVEANNKKYARVKIIKTIAETLHKALKP